MPQKAEIGYPQRSRPVYRYVSHSSMCRIREIQLRVRNCRTLNSPATDLRPEDELLPTQLSAKLATGLNDMLLE